MRIRAEQTVCLYMPVYMPCKQWHKWEVQCSADLKVLGGRLLASCEGGSKLGRAVLSW